MAQRPHKTGAFQRPPQTRRRYNRSPIGPQQPPGRLIVHGNHQQDAIQLRWEGMVAGTDGSVDERTECMGAAYAVGDAGHFIKIVYNFV